MIYSSEQVIAFLKQIREAVDYYNGDNDSPASWAHDDAVNAFRRSVDAILAKIVKENHETQD